MKLYFVRPQQQQLQYAEITQTQENADIKFWLDRYSVAPSCDWLHQPIAHPTAPKLGR